MHVSRYMLPSRIAPLLLLLPGTLALAPLPARAASPDSLRLARLADYADRLAAFGFSGQIVVAERGRILLQRASGWADRRFGVPMTLETQLGIGSVTKAFVAAAILRLESQGRLTTADRIDRWIPGVPADKAAITIAQLLSHTAGVRRDVPDIPDAAPRDELVRAILAEPLVDRIGGPFHYSNSGYDVLAAIVERVSGETLAAFVRRELLAPAGLVSTGVAGTPELPAGSPGRGYNEWKEVSAWTEWPAGWKGTGSGRMVSNALDLWRWGEAVQNGKALRPAEWAKMSERRAVQEDSTFYGFGTHIALNAARQSIFIMGGDTDGYRAELRVYPDARRVIVVCTNQDLFGLGVQRRTIASTLSRLAQGQDPPIPPVPAPLAARDPAIGAWKLPTGGTVEIWNENGTLKLGASGQDAIDRFEPDPRDSTGARAAIRTKVETLLRAATRGDSALARTALTPGEFSFAYPFLAKRLQVLDALHDGMKGVTSLGMVSLPWDPGTRRAYLRLEYVDGANDLFLGWREGTLYDITFDEGRPFPVIYPVAPLAEGGYATWDAIRQRAVRFRVLTREGGAPRLLLAGEGGEITAKKLR